MTARNTPSAPSAGAVSAVSEERVRELIARADRFFYNEGTGADSDCATALRELLRLRAELAAVREANAAAMRVSLIHTATHEIAKRDAGYAALLADRDAVAADRDRLRADNAAMREALTQIVHTPAMPFPDPGAHSEHAFSDAVFRAWSAANRIARAALSPRRGEGE